MKNTKKYWKQWIYLDRRERNGIVVFALILSIVNIGGTFFEHQTEKEILVIKQLEASSASSTEGTPRSNAPAKTQMDIRSDQSSNASNFQKKRQNLSEKPLRSAQKETPMTPVIPVDLRLNPNTADASALAELGLSDGQVRNVINYRDKVGPFGSKEELLKLYTLDESDYKRIAAHIEIPTTPSVETSHEPVVTQKEEIEFQRVMDINSAPAEEWEELRGIGPYYAQKIIGYREKLGGFFHVDQIKETWDVPPEIIEENKSFLKVDTQVSTIDLTSADYKTLIKHPYLNKRHTKLLLKLQGKNINIDEQIMLDIFSGEEWQKVKHYLSW